MRRFNQDVSSAIIESMKVARLIKTNDPTVEDMPDLIKALSQNYKSEDWETIQYICERIKKVADGEIQKLHDHKKSLSAPIQEAFDVYNVNPKMQWKSAPQGAAAISAMIMAVLPEGYGNFEASRVTGAIKKFGDLKYQFGREYSPVIYTTGFKDKAELVNFFNTMKKAKPDEITISGADADDIFSDASEVPDGEPVHGFSVRAWWD